MKQAKGAIEIIPLILISFFALTTFLISQSLQRGSLDIRSQAYPNSQPPPAQSQCRGTCLPKGEDCYKQSTGTCNGLNKVCCEQIEKPYTTPATPITYSCNNSGKCVPDAKGFFKNLGDCEKECKIDLNYLPKCISGVSCDYIPSTFKGSVACSYGSTTLYCCPEGQKTRENKDGTYECFIPETKCDNFGGMTCNKSTSLCKGNHITQGDTSTDYCCEEGLGCKLKLTLSSPIPSAVPGQTFACSNTSDFLLAINPDSGVDWSRSLRCEQGCKDNQCINNKIITHCQEGQISLDGFEVCKDGYFQCIPGKIRQPLTDPGISNQNQITMCDKNGQVVDATIQTENYYQDLACKGNSLYRITKDYETKIKDCPTDTFCLSNNYYNTKIFGGCYSKDMVKQISGCTPGEIVTIENHKYTCTTKNFECIPGEKYGDIQTCQLVNGIPTLICIGDSPENINKGYACREIKQSLANKTISENIASYLLYKPCDPTSGDVFKGDVQLSNGNIMKDCRLFCDKSGIVQPDNCISSALSHWNEKICQGDKVIGKTDSARDEPQVLETCGYGPVCINRAGCVEGSLCKDGACMQRTTEDCSISGEIKPSASIPNTYVQCNGKTKKWEQFANGHEITWRNCPNHYKQAYLKSISPVQNELVSTNITFECKEKNFYEAGSTNTSGITIITGIPLNYPINIGCGDPDSSSSSILLCQHTIVHELGHYWELNNNNTPMADPVDNASFDQVVGCQEDPQNIGTYKFNESPVDDYAQTNCSEAFAEGVAQYASLQTACEMKENNPKQYNFFKNDPTSPFKGKEFCNK